MWFHGLQGADELVPGPGVRDALRGREAGFVDDVPVVVDDQRRVERAQRIEPVLIGALLDQRGHQIDTDGIVHNVVERQQEPLRRPGADIRTVDIQHVGQRAGEGRDGDFVGVLPVGEEGDLGAEVLLGILLVECFHDAAQRGVLLLAAVMSPDVDYMRRFVSAALGVARAEQQGGCGEKGDCDVAEFGGKARHRRALAGEEARASAARLVFPLEHRQSHRRLLDMRNRFMCDDGAAADAAAS